MLGRARETAREFVARRESEGADSSNRLSTRRSAAWEGVCIDARRFMRPQPVNVTTTVSAVRGERGESHLHHSIEREERSDL